MYAVFDDRNQQFRAAPGDRIKLPYNPELAPGSTVEFDKVYVIAGEKGQVGAPFIKGASVTAKVLGNIKGPKIIVQKFKRRKNIRRRTGFRAKYTEVIVESIKS